MATKKKEEENSSFEKEVKEINECLTKDVFGSYRGQ